MDIGEEHSRVLLDLSDVETIASILAVCHDSSEEWSLKTADAASCTFAFALWVRKGKAAKGNMLVLGQFNFREYKNEPRWACFSDGGLMNMGCRGSR